MDIQALYKQLALLPEREQVEFLRLLEELDSSRAKETARSHFLPFVKYLWPSFIEGYHHKVIAQLFDDIITGKKRRVIINMAPRHSKSEFASIYLPAFFLGQYPSKKIIQASNTSELAVGFGRRVRGIINSPSFQNIFPGVALSADSKAAGRWATNSGGEYYAIGVGGTVTGKGADLFIIDDPHSEQEAIIAQSTPEVYDKTMEWYETGPRQRLQPGGSIVIVMTRWGLRDLTAQLLKKQKNEPLTDQWEVIELPAILPSGSPIWPEFWSEEELLKTKASIPISRWNAQYQQRPTAEEGALIKREYWRDWEEEKPPKVDTIIQSWDTAMTGADRANYSAVTTWGVFFNEKERRNQLILMDAVRGKWDFPTLKQRAFKYYKQWEPDVVLVESRAAGMPLIYEFRQAGLPVQDFVVGRGTATNPNDKVSRVNNITDIFASENVWAPKDRLWAQEVIEECASFPAGENDDYVDTVTMAMTRFRQGGWVGTVLDRDDSEDDYRPQIHEYY